MSTQIIDNQSAIRYNRTVARLLLTKLEKQMSNTTFNIDHEIQALMLLEQVRNVIESNFYQMRDDVLDSDRLQDMRTELRDACDTLMQAVRHIDQLQQQMPVEEYTA
jgi:hypothetical protein